jgi:hypothetical protein
LKDEETGRHYLIELKIGGDLDNKKVRAEKEALLEQYAILVNTLGTPERATTISRPGIRRRSARARGSRSSNAF